MNLRKPIFLKVSYLYFLAFLLLFSGWSNTVYTQNCERTNFRSIDGSCNNLYKRNWGKAKNKLVRELPAKYATSNPYGDMVKNRPNPRKISNEIFTQSVSIPNKGKLSSFVFTWGQFIDHDLDIVPVNPHERANIPLPTGESTFTKDIAFNRSTVHTGTGIFNSREHTNNLTAWIDASQVYGSDEQRARWLRTYSHGRLKVSKGNLLPYNTVDGELHSPIDPTAPEMDDPFRTGRPHFVAGDIRASEQPGLTTLHTLFVREHNRICEELLKKGFYNDEQMYQIARKQVGALIQHITYIEFLPALGIRLTPYRGYNPNVKPDILQVFASAAYRIGHTMVTDELLMLRDDCSEVKSPLQLGEAFFNDKWIREYGIEPILKGLSVQQQEQVDAKIVNGLRNSLFNIPRLPSAIGLDLGAINIQRGRDHGLPDYNSIRAHFTGQRAYSFQQINSNTQVWQPLAAAYKNKINEIDPWVGMLCEEHFPGSNLGRTMHNILSLQFERIRDGDYYYYENDPFFSRAELRAIKNTKLSKVIENNTNLNIHTNAFKARKTKCNTAVIPSTPDTPADTPTNVITLCNSLNIEMGNDKMVLTQLPNTVAYFQLFSSSWKYIDGCTGNCENRQEINNLKNGTYRIFIYDQYLRPICSENIYFRSTKNNAIEHPSNTRSGYRVTSIRRKNTTHLFPNPANQEVYVQLSEQKNLEKVQINIYNNYGQLVRKFSQLPIIAAATPFSVEGLETGMYQVQIIRENDVVETHKLVIQR